MFDAVSNLKHVWMGGNELNCSSVTLPAGARCIEEHCGVERGVAMVLMGDGFCRTELDSAECAWDGGDCG